MNYVLIDTIAAMEHELETLTTMVVNTKVGSPEWVMYTSEIEDLKFYLVELYDEQEQLVA